MTFEQQEFITQITESDLSREQWLTLVRFGVNQLAEDATFFLFLLESELRWRGEEVCPANIAGLMEQVGVRFQVA